MSLGEEEEEDEAEAEVEEEEQEEEEEEEGEQEAADPSGMYSRFLEHSLQYFSWPPNG